MDIVKKLFPFSFMTKNTRGLIIIAALYVLADIICGLILGFLTWIPVLGILFGIIGTVAGLYFLAGLVLAIVYYFGVFDQK